MARGRVIDKKIHLNEQLAKLPIEARYLYKGMIIHADDEGRLKASPAILKAQIFPFDEAIRVDTVKKWRDQIVATQVATLYAAGGQEYLVHPNWERWQPLRKDRARPSDCPVPNLGEDNQVTTNCQPNGNQLTTSCQPLPNPTEPNRTEDNNVVDPPDKPAGPTPEDLVSLWNKTAHPNLPRVQLLTETRKRQAKSRLSEYPEQVFWEQLLSRVNRSPLLRGESTSWRASFDWLLQPRNLTKVLEGNYDPDRRR